MDNAIDAVVVACFVLLGIFIGLQVGDPYGGRLDIAQRGYLDCIALQAPEPVCLKRYLLPEEPKP